ncbi:hypothetical protein [Halorubrum ezzemoulense]|uniref:hypothetical protein n=1 Tax=Halorubrum ezzemoulense TaxID=337243 RepID=UPI0011408D05|nr:hypothetical protein [Halorubrum ezzemoulense]
MPEEVDRADEDGPAERLVGAEREGISPELREPSSVGPSDSAPPPVPLAVGSPSEPSPSSDAVSSVDSPSSSGPSAASSLAALAVVPPSLVSITR